MDNENEVMASEPETTNLENELVENKIEETKDLLENGEQLTIQWINQAKQQLTQMESQLTSMSEQMKQMGEMKQQLSKLEKLLTPQNVEVDHLERKTEQQRKPLFKKRQRQK